MDESLLLILRLSWIILLVFSFFLSLFLPPWAPPVHQHESLLLFLFHFLSLSLLRTFRRNCSLSPPTLHLFIAYCCRLCLFASIRKKKIQLFFFPAMFPISPRVFSRVFLFIFASESSSPSSFLSLLLYSLLVPRLSFPLTSTPVWCQSPVSHHCAN